LDVIVYAASVFTNLLVVWFRFSWYRSCNAINENIVKNLLTLSMRAYYVGEIPEFHIMWCQTVEFPRTAGVLQQRFYV